MYTDRMMEMRNKLSEQRSGLGGELSSKLHVGPELDVLCDAVHVCPHVDCGRCMAAASNLSFGVALRNGTSYTTRTRVDYVNLFARAYSMGLSDYVSG